MKVLEIIIKENIVKYHRDRENRKKNKRTTIMPVKERAKKRRKARK
jgi:glycerol-3-phosphate cytidylyltransferase-like family protein